jgi:hypothetical protein
MVITLLQTFERILRKYYQISHFESMGFASSPSPFPSPQRLPAGGQGEREGGGILNIFGGISKKILVY